jgi:hypothetical protein
MSWLFDEHSWFMAMLGGSSESELKIISDLKESGAYKSAKIINYSACYKDSDEIVNSDKFKEYQRKSDRLVDND